MSTSTRNSYDKADDAMSQITRLREQVESLLRDKAGPALDAATERMEYAAEAIRGRADSLAEVVRDRPLMAVGIAVAIGFLLGRSGR